MGAMAARDLDQTALQVLLQPQASKDYGPNGLRAEGRNSVAPQGSGRAPLSTATGAPA